MSKSAFSDAHQVMVKALTQARRDAGIHQADLAAKIGKDQSYISNIERGQRRVDVVEFYVIVKAMDADPIDIFSKIAKSLPDVINI